jgi:hypothetical protein
MKLDLGSGQHPREGFEGVDLYAREATHKVDLFRFPWPFASDSVEELHCSHFIEHVPLLYAAPGADPTPLPANSESRDLLVLFFDECWRILRPDGRMQVIWPALQSVRSFQDPTHRRFIPGETLSYFSKAWREANGLGHYLGSCDMVVESLAFTPHPTLTQNGQFSNPEATMQAVNLHWNLAMDQIATLRAVK